MSRATRWSLLVVLALLAGACSHALLTHFPHRQHLANLECGGEGQPQCLTCLSCHRDEAGHGSWSAPTAARCEGCHDDAMNKFRHATRSPAAVLPAGKKIAFPHPQHLELKEIKGQCVKCHAGAVGVEGGQPLFPPMATCLDCHHHREEFDRNECTTCHRPGDLKGLQPVSFLSHDSGWLKRHGDAARAEPQRCETCHAQSSCDVCHDASRPQTPSARNPEKLGSSYVHRFDFLSRHAIEASSQPGLCVTCHQRTECDACHTARGVSGSGGRSPHPVGWASGLGAATNLHGPAARRDISSCAACHDQGPVSNCVQCHKVGAMGGNPHPTGWQSSQPLQSAACAPCHGGGL